MVDIIIKGSRLKVIESRLKDPTPYLKRVGVMMKGRAAATFKDQGRDGIKWKPRAVPNVIGIIKDAEAGRKSIPKRRFEDRPAGIDTRLLARSNSYQVEGTDTVAIGSTLNYATKVQRGGKSTVRVSMIARRNLSELIERARKKMTKGRGSRQDEMLVHLGWLLYTSQVKKNVPARPYVFFSDKDRTDVFSMARDFFGGDSPGTQEKP